MFAFAQQNSVLQMKRPVTAAQPDSPQIKVVGRMGETEFATERAVSRSTMRTPQVQRVASRPDFVYRAECPYLKLVIVGHKIP